MAKKTTIGFDELLRELKQGHHKPVYMLAGEEDYFIDQLTEHFDNLLDESQKEFDYTAIYANKSTSMEDIIMAARRYPMMSPFQIVIVKEAQNLPKDFDALTKYLQQPVATTILIFCYRHGTPDTRLAAIKAIEKVGVYYEAARPYENQIPSWLNNYARTKNVTLDPKAGALIIDYVGCDLVVLAHTIDKLKLRLKEGETIITPELVYANTAISREFNVFEFQDALAKHDIVKSYRIVEVMQESKEFPVQMVTAILYRFFANLIHYKYLGNNMSDSDKAKLIGINPYFIKDFKIASQYYNLRKCHHIMHYICAADAESKGYNVTINRTSHDILRELVYKILH